MTTMELPLPALVIIALLAVSFSLIELRVFFLCLARGVL
jgi:hypothetical protein